MREGRKWGVQIVLASQLLDDFSDDMVDMQPLAFGFAAPLFPNAPSAQRLSGLGFPIPPAGSCVIA